MQGVSKGALQWYSKCYCVATFTFKGVEGVQDDERCIVYRLLTSADGLTYKDWKIMIIIKLTPWP
jgi:hypothetical protein